MKQGDIVISRKTKKQAIISSIAHAGTDGMMVIQYIIDGQPHGCRKLVKVVSFKENIKLDIEALSNIS